jgi:purine nucleosidase
MMDVPMKPLLLLLAGLALQAQPPKTPVILSTDVGNEIDDQWAIVYMLANPALDVKAIISAHAPNLPPHYTWRVLRDVVEKHLRMSVHPPLFEGSPQPLENDTTPRNNPAVDFIVQSSKSFDPEHRLNLLTIGAATDAASAILQDPSIADRIRIVAMGFMNWPDGGNEYNLANDIKAWQVILRSRVPVVIGSGQTCKKFLALTPSQAKQLLDGLGPIGAWLWDEYEIWYYRFVKPMRQDDFSKPKLIWDIITLAYLQGFTRQDQVARPILRDDMKFEHPATSQTLAWITAVDAPRLWSDFAQKVTGFQRTHAVAPKP